jgi:peptide deformylase
MSHIFQTKNKDEDKILRMKAEEIKKNEFGSPELHKILHKMLTTVEKEDDGVALAAPQIGIPKRIFVIADRAFDPKTKWRQKIFINPKILKTSKKMEEKEEGCLSVRDLYGKTFRHINTTVEAYDENGNKFSYGASGLLSHIFQHEIDHLEGTLFIDHGHDFYEYDHTKINERKG